ncbi:MAG: MFS transporter [Novosphingobium sp.]
MKSDANPRKIAVPRTVWALGLVSMMMDISSEMIHALLPLFITGVLGASVVMVGVIDGIAEATASISKVFSGYISDRMGRRKPLILLGYGLGALSKPLFALAAGPIPVLGARFIDRIGKGLRGAPRDALVADVTPPEILGRAYGLRQALDTVGAFAGPLLAIGLMLLLAGDMRTVFWLAAIPGGLAVLLVLFAVHDPDRRHDEAGATPPLHLKHAARLPVSFWAVTGIGVLFTMARFSEAFLVLKANQEGLSLAMAPLVLVAMNLVYSLGAYPAGAFADRFGPHGVLLASLLCLALADLLLALGNGLAPSFAGIALWGLHMALSQGLLAQLVARNSPPQLRGSAFGLFNLMTGITMLAASVLAGVLWEWSGSQATFLAGAIFAAAAACALIGLRGAIRLPA